MSKFWRDWAISRDFTKNGQFCPPPCGIWDPKMPVKIRTKSNALPSKWVICFTYYILDLLLFSSTLQPSHRLRYVTIETKYKHQVRQRTHHRQDLPVPDVVGLKGQYTPPDGSGHVDDQTCKWTTFWTHQLRHQNERLGLRPCDSDKGWQWCTNYTVCTVCTMCTVCTREDIPKQIQNKTGKGWN